MENQEQLSNLLGKRYYCESCGTELICVSRGEGRFQCHGSPMVMKGVKPLPSSD